MRFSKMHGAGNDFILVDARGSQQPWGDLAVHMCDRHTGIGADGLILVLPSEGADLRMRMFNPDGSEAEMCGNGIRCLAKFALEGGLAGRQAKELAVETLAGVRGVRPLWSDVSAGDSPGRGQVGAVQVNMGEPRFRPEDLPIELPAADQIWDYPLEVDGHRLKLAFASMGNPHAVQFITTAVADFPLEQIGPKVEYYRLFPRRINFEIANILDRSRIDVRVWERGAGLTLACGTGACAVAAIAIARGLVDSPVGVHLPGGTLSIAWDGHGDLLMTGPVAEVFRGEWLERK